MISGNKKIQKSQGNLSSTNNCRSSRSKNISNTGSLQNKAKAQSQEDLTKSKERITTRSKSGNGSTSSTKFRNKDHQMSSRGAGDGKSRDKLSTKQSTSSTTTNKVSAGSVGSLKSTRRSISKSKTEADKQLMESQIKELETLSKSKDQEINVLKKQLDKMMELMKSNEEAKNSFTKLVKLENGESCENNHLKVLQKENRELKERINTLSQDNSNQLPAQQPNQDLSNKDLMTSSTEDVTSQDDVVVRSTAVSRSTSTENLLDDSQHYLTLSGTPDINEQQTCADHSDKVSQLTERIHEMEETHICTNEELEATMQELNDLQKTIPDLTSDNENLKKQLVKLSENLCTSEKRLHEHQIESKHLRALVSDQLSTNKDQLKLEYMSLLDERRDMLDLVEQLNQEISTQHKGQEDLHMQVMEHRDKERQSQRALQQAINDKIVLENKIKELTESADEETALEVLRLKDELMNERARMDNLVKNCESENEVNFQQIVENLRTDRQIIEDKYTILEEEYRQCQNENDKLDARVAGLEEDLEETLAKAKRDSSELSELIDRLHEQNENLKKQLEEANENVFLLEDSVEQQLAIQKHERHKGQQLQNQINQLKEERVRLYKEIQQSKREHRNKTEEWKQFQNDMQIAVSIANTMKNDSQVEVTKLREEKQNLEDLLTKLRVENEQLRRKRVSSVTMHSQAILEARRHQNMHESTQLSHEGSYKPRRKQQEPSPGVQSLIKSFDSQTREPTISSTLVSNNAAPIEAQVQTQNVQSTSKLTCGPSIAAVSPIQRHHSLSSINSCGTTSTPTNKLTQNAASSASSSKTGTPDSNMTGSCDLSQLSSYLRRNSNAESRKPSSLDVSCRGNTQPADALESHRHQQQKTIDHRNKAPPSRALSNNADPLVVLARKYGGSKRNALLQWCQKKTKDYENIEVTNFSSSWSDGLALCALMHSYLPAHIPYTSLVSAYSASQDDRTRKNLQAKHFRLAFAAAESVGIEPTLSVESMTLQDRPEWQSVMHYVTQLYKYFET